MGGSRPPYRSVSGAADRRTASSSPTLGATFTPALLGVEASICAPRQVLAASTPSPPMPGGARRMGRENGPSEEKSENALWSRRSPAATAS